MMADIRGLMNKYVIIRTDGDPTGKHAVCNYFVLDIDHDEDARDALSFYADMVQIKRPNLSADLRRLLDELSS